MTIDSTAWRLEACTAAGYGWIVAEPEDRVWCKNEDVKSRRALHPAVLGVLGLVIMTACTASHGPRARPGTGGSTTSSPQGAVRSAPLRLHGRIAFVSDKGGNVDVYILELPSGRLRRLTASPGADLSPSWSPDETRIAFRSDRTGDDEVFVMNADGSNEQNLTRDPASDYSPAWSPDGRHIAFASSRSDPAGNDIWIMGADGSDPRPIVEESGIDEYPVWSPDGTRLAFSCSNGVVLPQGVGDFEICIADADGSRVERISDAEGITSAGGWSRDGLRLAFSSSRSDGPEDVSSCGDIFVMDADGTNIIRRTRGPASDCRPSWSQDGRYFLFSSDRAHPGQDADLYAMTATGSRITRLTDLDAEEQEPELAPDRGGP